MLFRGASGALNEERKVLRNENFRVHIATAVGTALCTGWCSIQKVIIHLLLWEDIKWWNVCACSTYSTA